MGIERLAPAVAAQRRRASHPGHAQRADPQHGRALSLSDDHPAVQHLPNALAAHLPADRGRDVQARSTARRAAVQTCGGRRGTRIDRRDVLERAAADGARASDEARASDPDARARRHRRSRRHPQRTPFEATAESPRPRACREAAPPTPRLAQSRKRPPPSLPPPPLLRPHPSKRVPLNLPSLRLLPFQNRPPISRTRAFGSSTRSTSKRVARRTSRPRRSRTTRSPRASASRARNYAKNTANPSISRSPSKTARPS